MTFRLPTPDDLRRLAAANHFELSDDEMAGFQSLIPGFLSSYESLERLPMPQEPLKYPDRDPWQRPSRQDDPFNAILRRCRLNGSSSESWPARDSG